MQRMMQRLLAPSVLSPEAELSSTHPVLPSHAAVVTYLFIIIILL